MIPRVASSSHHLWSSCAPQQVRSPDHAGHGMVQPLAPLPCCSPPPPQPHHPATQPWPVSWPKQPCALVRGWVAGGSTRFLGTSKPAGAVLSGSLCPARTAAALGSGPRGPWRSVRAAREVEKGRDKESFGTALANGDIDSRQTATQSMSETRPWRRDNSTVTVKRNSNHGLLALVWEKSGENNKRPTTRTRTQALASAC